ncbi:MAG: aminotransferase class V-fold PLP-dependent enzyme [Clostridiales bacterium]|nr:aminotransferase class V-fold PLP-dependent enzyme [Clostridiales bacterium]
MIYLDNSSTTHKKPLSVKLATLKGVSSLSVNPSRAGHKLALKGAEKIYNTREQLANYLGTTPDNVIFTSGCTMALNLAIRGTVQRNGHIITTIFEHNSTLRTLEALKSTHNIEVSYLTPNKLGQITTNSITNAIKENTYMIIINHTSNVTGHTQNIESIGKVCKKHHLLFLVDGAQSVGHHRIDMKKNNINLLTIAGHKGLYAPEGIGALLINNIKVTPLIYGGTGTHSDKLKQPTDYPDGLESGTPNIVGILGLAAGLNFVTKHEKQISKKITKLSIFAFDELSKIKNVTLYADKNNGVISLSVKGKSSTTISDILDEKYHICTRSGLHCAPLIHKYYNTAKSGLTRISISYFNKKSDIKKLIFAIKKIALD